MNVSKEEAHRKIEQLVERFREHVEEYKRNVYNEHQTRVDYINPFFKALGWDMDNEQGYAEAYREVIHEDKVKVGSSTKAPDYGFTLFGQRKFFVDAKKPAINIKSDIAPAYQVRRYGWSAKVPISIVTDFEEFSIYDCTKKPKPTDKASVARIKYITYDQYLDEFDFLWDVFAKENLPKGRFDKYVQSDTKRKGTATVDDEFLKSIEQWRTYLATTIALRNKSLNEDEINYAVQKIIDRIIFLRMCEDRGVEQYGELKKATQKGDIYQNLFALYRMADDKYNSGLFDFKEDKITPTLTVDNKVMKNIIKELYYPNCEYEFSVMPADILGSVYEQFLGKTIRLTKAHHAKIKEKPEVRKAGGVYYTPKYIVDYIVENTVGKLIEGKTPKLVEKLKICDPACGSGSFLIGAYQFLLDWHLKYYTDNSPKKKKDSPLTPDGNLTTAEKKRILLNNIFGVDIDTQAVEVTKLNLLLKALEGETQASISQQLSLFHERVLPNLGSNIKCGNSLIGSDFYDNQLDLFPEQMKKINAFDWEEGFSEIFKYGGFDAVIGNPPYGALFASEETQYFLEKYHLQDYQLDSYLLFIENTFSFLNKGGFFGFIIPNTWLLNLQLKTLRKYIFSNIQIEKIKHYKNPVFRAAVVDTEVFVFRNKKPKHGHSINIEIIEKDNTVKLHKTPQVNWANNEGNPVNIFKRPEFDSIINKMCPIPFLDDVCKITQGTKPFQTGKGKPPQTREIVNEKPFVSEVKMDKLFRPLLRGSLMNRYKNLWQNNYWIKFGDWLAEPRYSANHDAPEKIIIRQTGDKLICTLDCEQFIVRDNLYTIIDKQNGINLSFITGLLNSQFLNWYYQNIINSEVGEALAQVKRGHLAIIPIMVIDAENVKQKQIHDQIVKFVNNILKLNKQLQTTKLETQRQQIQRAINHADKKIDELVYGLYGLSKEEIEIVENT